MYAKLKAYYLLFTLSIAAAALWRIDSRIDTLEDRLDRVQNTTSFQMYESIEKWSDSLKIPKYVAYNVAYLETRYRGPFDISYEHRAESSAGAVGPMQIITRYAHTFAGRRVSEKELKSNVDLNVMVSMKMLRKWFSIYRDWALACGAYNTGRPVVNEYAMYATVNKDYKNKWIKSYE